jgi:hypothetical protein
VETSAVKEQSPLRGASLVLRSGFCPFRGERPLPPLSNDVLTIAIEDGKLLET